MTGSFFYMEELGQYLFDNGVDVYKYTPDGDEVLLDTRYTFQIPKYSKTKLEAGTTLIVTGASFPLLLRSYKQWLLDAERVLILNTSSTFASLREAQADLSTMKKTREKCYLLFEPQFETTSLKSCWFEGNRLIPISRGFYFKYYVKPKDDNNVWYLYQNNYAGVFAYDEDKQRALNCMADEKYNVAVDVYDSLNPANKYSGLIYVRHIDYMPRLPFEFWHYEKPVRCFAISDGLKKRLPELKADGKPFILDNADIPKWDMSQVLF